LSKGGEVGEVGKLIGADRTLDQTLALCVRSAVEMWLSLGRWSDRTQGELVTWRAVSASGECDYTDVGDLARVMKT
jgi:hypothetical protein